VHIVSSPIFEGLALDDQFRRFWDSQISTLRASTGVSPGVHLHPQVISFPASQMESADHVVGVAASTYTRAVVELLNGRGGIQLRVGS
jgi:hypothetical protein